MRIHARSAREAPVEPSALELRQARGGGHLEMQRNQVHRRVGEHRIDDGLVFLGREGAGRIEHRPPGTGQIDRPAQQRFLQPADVLREPVGAASHAAFALAHGSLGRARRIHEHAIEQRAARQETAVRGHGQHVQVSGSIDVPGQCPDARFARLDRHQRTAVPHQVGQVRGLPAGSRTEVEHSLAGPRTEDGRRDARRGALHVVQAEPVLQRQGDRLRFALYLEEVGLPRQGSKAESLFLEPGCESSRFDPPGPDPDRGRLGTRCALEKLVEIGDDVPVPVEGHAGKEAPRALPPQRLAPAPLGRDRSAWTTKPISLRDRRPRRFPCCGER